MKKELLLLLAINLAGCSSGNILIQEEPLFVPEKFNIQRKLEIQEKINSDEKKANLLKWWEQFNNENLVKLIDFSQQNSPTIGASLVNIKKYENILISSKSQTKPNLNFNGNSDISKNSGSSIVSQSSIALTTSWELDLFRKYDLINEINKKEVENAKATWHDAKTTIAAETARTYFNYQFCKKTLDILEQDYESRKKQNEITKLKVKAGFETLTSLYQNEAGLSQAQSNIVEQKYQCDTYVKSLIALTSLNENDVLSLLSNYQQKIDKYNLYIPVTVPSKLLTQRSDIFQSVNNIKIAAFELAKSQKDYLPSVSFRGNISGYIGVSSDFQENGSTLSIGPIAVTLPIFDNGILKSNEELAKQKYEQAKLEFKSNLRNAIKEIEISMMNLQTRYERLVLIEKSIANYKKAYDGTMETYRAGISSLFDLEDVRRAYLSEVSNKINNELQTINAWIDLYKAVGGGFEKTEVKINE